MKTGGLGDHSEVSSKSCLPSTFPQTGLGTESPGPGFLFSPSAPLFLLPLKSTLPPVTMFPSLCKKAQRYTALTGVRESQPDPTLGQPEHRRPNPMMAPRTLCPLWLMVPFQGIFFSSPCSFPGLLSHPLFLPFLRVLLCF